MVRQALEVGASVLLHRVAPLLHCVARKRGERTANRQLVDSDAAIFQFYR